MLSKAVNFKADLIHQIVDLKDFINPFEWVKCASFDCHNNEFCINSIAPYR